MVGEGEEAEGTQSVVEGHHHHALFHQPLYHSLIRMGAPQTSILRIYSYFLGAQS